MLLTASPTTPIHTFHGMGVMPMLPSLTQLDVQRTRGNMMTTSRPRLKLPVSWLLLLPKMFGYHSTACIWSTMWSRSWVLAHERENMHWCHVQVLQSSYCSVWQSLSERANNQRHCPPIVYQRKEVFPGMLSNIDNCHGGWQGQRLEAVASHDLWIWHSFLECQDLAMISICSNGYRYLIDLLNAPLLWFPMRSSMVIIITNAII
jgi:hypothetical protein